MRGRYRPHTLVGCDIGRDGKCQVPHYEAGFEPLTDAEALDQFSEARGPMNLPVPLVVIEPPIPRVITRKLELARVCVPQGEAPIANQPPKAALTPSLVRRHRDCRIRAVVIELTP